MRKIRVNALITIATDKDITNEEAISEVEIMLNGYSIKKGYHLRFHCTTDALDKIEKE